jgi:hypothetical protein
VVKQGVKGLRVVKQGVKGLRVVKQGVYHIVVLLFTLKSVLRPKKKKKGE